MNDTFLYVNVLFKADSHSLGSVRPPLLRESYMWISIMLMFLKVLMLVYELSLVLVMCGQDVKLYSMKRC